MKHILLPLFLAVAANPGHADTPLPVIGDATSAIVSLEQERRIGRSWVRSLRGQAPLLQDPLITIYVDDLLQKLATNSDLQDPKLTLVLLRNSSLNAFAVPGGIIGIHAGLFLYADNESEFASVLAHELSHLSQRHFATSLEQQQGSMPIMLASALATILLAASTQGDAALATLTAGQAAIQQRQLAFSRAHEQEADRIGMQVLTQTGFEARAMPRMFQHLQRDFSMAGNKPPEFLLTHPVSESRIADALNRLTQLPRHGLSDSLAYQLMKMRVVALLSTNKDKFLQQMQSQAASNRSQTNQYGLALAATAAGNFELAQSTTDWLLTNAPDSQVYRLLQAQLWLDRGQSSKAINLLVDELALYPDNHPATMLYARALRQEQRYGEESELLRIHSRRYPEDTQLWYELAEAYGQNNDTLGVHQARAEYFLLVGAIKKAEEHWKLALKQSRASEQDKALMRNRLKETQALLKDREKQN